MPDAPVTPASERPATEKKPVKSIELLPKSAREDNGGYDMTPVVPPVVLEDELDKAAVTSATSGASEVEALRARVQVRAPAKHPPRASVSLLARAGRSSRASWRRRPRRRMARTCCSRRT